MTPDAITEKVYAVISSVLPYGCPDALDNESNLFEMGLDSINAMTLIFNLQATFGVHFEATDITLDNFKSVGTIVHLLRQKQGLSVDT